jgi:hypothetical protein
VLPSLTSKPDKLRRIISVAALLFVFFLPLHVHFSAVPQISKECTCIQGSRVELALTTDTCTCAPSYTATLLTAENDFYPVNRSIDLRHVRAPPATFSL